MTKVLYVGHYRERGGWSNCATNQILAMDSVGINVVCRSVELTRANNKPHPTLEELEQKDLKNVTHCIQHVLPHHMVGTNSFKNIAYYVAESIHTKKNAWHNFLKLMGEVWVPNEQLKQNTEQFIAGDIKVIPHAFNMETYKKKYEVVDFGLPKDTFKFYSIADLNARKNITSLIRCYYNAFGPNDNVALILKVKKFGHEERQIQEYLNSHIQNVQKRMRLYPKTNKYPPIVFITSDTEEDFINTIHLSCDCFVSCSHAEGWSMPAFDAMCFGNTPICTSEGGTKEFITADKGSGTLVSSRMEICDQQDGAFSHIFTGSEFWFSPDEKEIVDSMMHYYKNRDRYRSIKTSGASIAYGEKFSYDSVGNKIGEQLNA